MSCKALFLTSTVARLVLAASEAEDEEIVVTACPFRPDAVVVDGEEIDSSPGDSVADVLHWSGACDVYRRGSGQAQADLGYRASTFEQTGVFIDGVPVRDPQTGHFNLDLPLWRGALEAVEITSLPWGPDGLAGAVNFVLKAPVEKALGVEGGGGEFGLLGTAFSASMPGAGLWGAYEHSDGYRRDTDYDIFSAGAIVDMEELLSSRAFLGWSSRKFGANDFYGDYPTRDEWEETETFLANWRGQVEAGSSEITPLLYYRRHWDHFLLERGEIETDLGLRFDAHSDYSAQACPLPRPSGTSTGTGSTPAAQSSPGRGSGASTGLSSPTRSFAGPMPETAASVARWQATNALQGERARAVFPPGVGGEAVCE